MPRYHMTVTLECPDSEGLEYVEQFQDLIMGWRWVTEWRIGAGLPKRQVPRATLTTETGTYWEPPDYTP